MSYISFFYIVKNEKNLSAANELLLKKSKELNIIRKTSLLLQKSLDYEELIEVLLNTLTSKEALDYDRALIFLYDERMNEFTPYYLKYKNHDKKISLYSKEEEENPIRKIKIPNSIINPFGKAYDTKEPIVINNIDLNDPIQRLVWELLNLANFGLLPLIEKNSIKGIIMVDNYNTKLPIENEDLDNTVSIIHQASTALVNSSLYKQSQNMAYTDGLTGLFNKRFLDFSFEQSLSKLLSKESSLALLIVDVDYFKRYNDTNGHIAGNMALKRIAELLLAESRNKDVVVRFGGEEFCILLFDIEKIGALGVAERMRFKIEKENFIKESKEASGQLTISIGISIFNGENNLEELVDKADKALYEAKNSGRNRIIFIQVINMTNIIIFLLIYFFLNRYLYIFAVKIKTLFLDKENFNSLEFIYEEPIFLISLPTNDYKLYTSLPKDFKIYYDFRNFLFPELVGIKVCYKNKGDEKKSFFI